jgi:Transposase IS4
VVFGLTSAYQPTWQLIENLMQVVCCGSSGVMLQLLLVKTNKEQEALDKQQSTTAEQIEQMKLQHGTKVLMSLVKPWHHSQRLIAADSYFASVHTAETMLNIGLRFIGVVKTATRRYPMQYLSELELEERGNRSGLVSCDGNGVPRFLAFTFVNRDRRYFIATAGSLCNGTAISRYRWRQVAKVYTNQDPTRLHIEIPQPTAAEMYYNICAKIDNHNRDRSDTLQLEQKFETNDWSMRVNFSIFAMIVVDTWKVYSKLSFNINEEGKRINKESQKQFYGRLAAELIDNREGAIVTRD